MVPAREDRPLKHEQFAFAVDQPAGTSPNACPSPSRSPTSNPQASSTALSSVTYARQRALSQHTACKMTAIRATRAQVQATSEIMSLPSLMVLERRRTPPPQNDAMNIEDSRLFNDTSSSSFTVYSNTQTDITSKNNVNSTMNYGAVISVSWESDALRFPSFIYE